MVSVFPLPVTVVMPLQPPKPELAPPPKANVTPLPYEP